MTEANPQGPVRVVPSQRDVALAFVDRLESHMGKQDQPVLLEDCHEAARVIRTLLAAPSPAAPIRVRGVTITEEAYDLVTGFLYACRDTGKMPITPAGDVIEMLESNPPALAPPEGVEGWREIGTAPTDGPSFMICTERRNVYVAYRRSDEGERFLHFASGLAREINEAAWGWRPNPEPLPAPPVPLADGGR